MFRVVRCLARQAPLRRAPSSAVLRRTYVQCRAADVGDALGRWTPNAKLREWVAAHVKLMGPSNVHFCDGAPARPPAFAAAGVIHSGEKKKNSWSPFCFFFLLAAARGVCGRRERAHTSAADAPRHSQAARRRTRT